MINKHMKMKRGFTFIEAAAGLVIITLSVGSITATVMSIGRASSANNARASRDQERSMNQEIAALGYAPDMISANPMTGAANFVTTSNTNAILINRQGAAKITGTTATLDDGRTAMSPRASAMGIQILTTADSVPLTMNLLPPSFNLANSTTPSSFPITNLILANGMNPPGTFYVYTTTGTSPTSGSPRWSNSTSFNVSSYPRVVMAQARHPDPSYSPSSVVTLTLGYPDAGYSFRRNDNSTSKSWTYLNVIGNQNGIKPAFNDTAYDAIVTFTNSNETKSHITQSTVSNPSISAFTGVPPSGTVQIRLQPKNPNFQATSSSTFNEQISGVETVLPDFDGFE